MLSRIALPPLSLEEINAHVDAAAEKITTPLSVIIDKILDDDRLAPTQLMERIQRHTLLSYTDQEATTAWLLKEEKLSHPLYSWLKMILVNAMPNETGLEPDSDDETCQENLKDFTQITKKSLNSFLSAFHVNDLLDNEIKKPSEITSICEKAKELIGHIMQETNSYPMAHYLIATSLQEFQNKNESFDRYIEQQRPVLLNHAAQAGYPQAVLKMEDSDPNKVSLLRLGATRFGSIDCIEALVKHPSIMPEEATAWIFMLADYNSYSSLFIIHFLLSLPPSISTDERLARCMNDDTRYPVDIFESDNKDPRWLNVENVGNVGNVGNVFRILFETNPHSVPIAYYTALHFFEKEHMNEIGVKACAALNQHTTHHPQKFLLCAQDTINRDADFIDKLKIILTQETKKAIADYALHPQRIKKVTSFLLDLSFFPSNLIPLVTDYIEPKMYISPTLLKALAITEHEPSSSLELTSNTSQNRPFNIR